MKKDNMSQVESAHQFLPARLEVSKGGMHRGASIPQDERHAGRHLCVARKGGFFLQRAWSLVVISVIAGCAANRPAPVSDARPAPPATPSVTVVTPSTAAVPVVVKPLDGEKIHVIHKGDTLIGIALQNGLDYRELAAWNNIENPNVIKLGDSLRLTAPGTPQIVAGAPQTPQAQPQPGLPVATPLILTPPPVAATGPGNTDKLKTEPKGGKVPYSDAAYAKLSAEAAASAGTPLVVVPVVAVPTSPAIAAPPSPLSATPSGNDDVDWSWPIQPTPKGKIIANFTDANKGIDISGTKNTPVLASAAGKVVYSGSGLRGYGHFVIIKHNNTWLSAYAHNEKILVMEGETVKKGQKIAEMGSSDTDQVKLHFEIRRQGKPVDPVKLLPN